MSDEFNDLLDAKPDPSRSAHRAIINMDGSEDWKWYERFLAHLINAVPVFAWFVVTYLLISFFGTNPELVGYRNAMLNLMVPSAAFSVLTLISGIILLSWLNPYMSPRKMMAGSSMDRIACCVYWGLNGLALALVISASVG